MASTRTVTAAMLAAVALVAVVGGTPAVSQSGPQERPASLLPPSGTGLPANSTTVRVAVRPDGTAEWAVQYRVALADENATAAFESARTRIESDPLQYTGPFAETMGDAAAAASAETGRDMEIRNVTVGSRRLPTGPTEFGVVTYRFEWTSFAATDGGRLTVGDALVGYFLGEEATLLVQWPAGHELERVSPEPDETRERAVVWEGPVEFAPGEPRVVATGGGSVPVAPLGAAALAVVLLGASLVGWRRYRDAPGEARDRSGPADDTPATTGGTGGADTATGDAAGTAAAAADASATDGATSTGPDAGAESGPDDAGAADEPEVPEELLSDPERVLNLVEERGGRMKQQEVVATLDWSETKTSQVVGDLQEEEKLEVYRLGRENVLALPGEMDV